MAHRIRLIACFFALACAGCGAFQNSDDALDTKSAAEAIPELTQQLMNALPGDSTVWKRYLSERAVYVAEAGEVATKAEVLAGFGPFPEGLSGSIEVKNPRITELGDIAISVFEAHEKQQVYDQQIEVNYLSTYTWRREDGHWRVIAAQTVVLAKDPRPLPIDTRRLGDYAGAYELSGKRRYRVEVRGDTLMGGPDGGELKPLIPVGDNVFADAGSNLGILRIFVRAPGGAVERIVMRRKFAYLDWMRVP